MQRKQFGKRGLDNAPTSWGSARVATAGFSPAMAAAPPSLDQEAGGSLSASVGGLIVSAFSFTGRTGLLNYWILQIAHLVFLICVATMLTFWLMDQNVQTSADVEQATGQPAFFAFMLVFVAASVFRLALDARRMHDRGVSALWLVTWFIPIVGVFFMLVQYFKNCFFLGDAGTNEFGPRP
ncbi:DUF805 domain-containing protein [Rhodobacterales bacterium]|nr:DUF805 domain-containing protein [Rhodobacterales bacterium]